MTSGWGSGLEEAGGWLGSTEANRMTAGLLTQLTGLMLCCCNQQPPTSASAIQNSNFPGAKCIH